MVDYTTSGKEKKKMGCLGILLILILVLALLGGVIYLFLPKIISSALSGGAISRILPDDLRRGSENLEIFLEENVNQLDRFGLTTDEATDIVSSIDYGTVEEIVGELEQSSVNNTSDLIDIVSKHIDLSSADIEKIKNEYDTEFSKENLNWALLRFNESPLIMKSGFRVVKETILEVLQSSEIDQNDVELQSTGDTGSNTTKKKK